MPGRETQAMPRARPGYERIDLELPAELAAPLRAESADKGEPVQVILARMIGRRYRVPYAQKRPGRPPGSPAKPAPKKRGAK